MWNVIAKMMRGGCVQVNFGSDESGGALPVWHVSGMNSLRYNRPR